MSFFSKQKGRMTHLLKQKSKIATKRKERVVYEAFDFLKKPRDQDFGQTTTPTQST